MTRRELFKRAIGMAGAVAVAPLARSSTIKALAPIIEYGTPIRGFAENIPPPDEIACKRPLDEIAASWLREIDHYEKTNPGFRALLSQRLIAQHVGLPWEEIQRALWKVYPEQVGLDGWTHHAYAISLSTEASAVRSSDV